MFSNNSNKTKSSWPVVLCRQNQQLLCQTDNAVLATSLSSSTQKQMKLITHSMYVCVCLPLYVCWVHKHGNRHDLRVSAVSCVSRALCASVCVCVHGSPVTPQACRATLSTLLVCLNVCAPAHVSAFTCMCVSICLLSPAVHSAPLGPVKIKGHFSKGQSSSF